MKTEELKSKGLTDEQIAYVMAENGKDIAREQSTAATVRAELDTANATIKNLQDTSKKFEGVDVDGLKKQLGDLQNKYNTDIGEVIYALDTFSAIHKQVRLKRHFK